MQTCDMAEEGRFEAGPNDDGVRIDRILRKLLRDVPLSHIYRMIRTGRVRVNGRRVKTGYRISTGDVVQLPEREGGEAEMGKVATAAVGIDII
ncbi:MAG: S4 domain-containing protein, partial [Spirochaetota bacterium]